jgi:hypothetical protein
MTGAYSARLIPFNEHRKARVIDSLLLVAAAF